MCIRMSRVLIFKSSASSCGDNQASQVELVLISADIQQFPQLNQLKESSCEKFDRTYCTVSVNQISQSWLMFGKIKHNFWERANISLESPFESSVSSHWSQVRVLFICVLSVTSLKSPNFWLKSSPQTVWTKVPPLTDRQADAEPSSASVHWKVCIITVSWRR